MKNALVITLALTSLFVNSCGSGGSAPVAQPARMDMPCWFLNPPRQNDDCANVWTAGTIYRTATAQSKDMNIALDKAKNAAVDDLAGSMESKMMSVTSRVQEEIGFGEDSELTDHFSKMQERMVKKSLRGYDVDKKDIKMKGDLYVAYVLASINVAEAQKMLLDEMKNDQLLAKRKEHQKSMAEMREILKEEYDD